MMATYQYTARDAVGNEVSSLYTDVASVSSLRRELVKLGYVLVRARRQPAATQPRGRVRPREVASFAYKFGGMYSAGLSIASCLQTLEQQANNAAFRAVLADVRRRVEAGASLKTAFEPHRNLFSDFFLGMIEAGESSGRLALSLDAGARYLEKRLELQQKTRAAFVYPLVVGVVCSLVVACLLIFVVPVFSQLYKKMHVPLPGPTQLLVVFSGLLRHWWWLLLPLGAALAVGGRRLLAHPHVRIHWDRLKLRMPLLGPLHHLVLASQFVRTFGMLISVGVPIVEALGTAGRVARNEEVARIAADLQDAVRAGRPIAGSLQAHRLFPPVVVQLVASGEEAGILPQMLAKAADLLDKDADRLTASLLVKLEPALTVLMGLVIGLILMGVYLPMFDYMAHLR
ncbi:MAG: type II secretion system F family protein [Planctomycetes bacterium]|jgi:type IV pilus assembly protein PilC|nr:type II secretion system F family protein [Planctomycetota bacterium]